MDARCPCGKEITHPQMQLCDNCYIQYRKGQYRLRDAERRKDPVYVDKINTYQKEKYHSEYRVDRLVNKTCSCGKKALKGSLYSLCRPCSILKAKTRKLKYQMDRKRNHIPTRIRENIKSRLKQAIKGRKSYSIIEYLGCSMPEYLFFLESKFYPSFEGKEMSWDNYGIEWHIDHIVRLGADYRDMGLFHYSNTQPMWKEEHFIKTGIENGQKMP